MADLTDLEIAICAAQAGAQAALAHRHSGTVQFKADQSPVSPGDTATDRAITEILHTHRPNDGILSEEQADSNKRQQCERVWIIDPIDGTKSYIKQGDDWAIQIALATSGKLTLGVIAQPCLNRIIAADLTPTTQPVLYHLKGPNTIQPFVPNFKDSQQPLEMNHLITSRRMAASAKQFLPASYSHTSCSSVGIKVLAILDGHADVYAHPHPINEWDIAAPAAVLIAAGGTATDCLGHPLRFNQAQPSCPGLLCSTRTDHHRLPDLLSLQHWQSE